MIQCVRLWTGDGAGSHFEDGSIELEFGRNGDLLTGKIPTASVSFEETARRHARLAHRACAPARGHAERCAGLRNPRQAAFHRETRRDLAGRGRCGRGHAWRHTDAEPWRRVYVVLAPGAVVLFRSTRGNP